MFRCKEREFSVVKRIDSVGKHVQNQHQSTYGECQNGMKHLRAVRGNFKIINDLLKTRKSYLSIIDSNSQTVQEQPSLSSIKILNLEQGLQYGLCGYTFFISANMKQHVQTDHKHHMNSDICEHSEPIKTASMIIEDWKTVLKKVCHVLFSRNKRFVLLVTLPSELTNLKLHSNLKTRKSKYWLYSRVVNIDFFRMFLVQMALQKIKNVTVTTRQCQRKKSEMDPLLSYFSFDVRLKYLEISMKDAFAMARGSPDDDDFKSLKQIFKQYLAEVLLVLNNNRK